jgi:hypothetical protein
MTSKLSTGRRSTPSAGRSEARKPGAGPASVGCSDEGESQKAGAEQGDPTGRQGKEAVGNEISISHDTPSDSHARPNLLKLSERATLNEAITPHPRSGPRANTLERMGEKDSGTEQTHHRSHCLEHCSQSFAPRAHVQKTVAGLHSQKHFRTRPHNAGRPRILGNRCFKRGQRNRCFRPQIHGKRV